MQHKVLIYDFRYIVKIESDWNLWSAGYKNINICIFQGFYFNKELKDEFHVFFIVIFI